MATLLTRFITCLAGSPDGSHVWPGVFNLAISGLLAGVIGSTDSLITDHIKIILTYVLFILSSGLSLVLLTWIAALLSRPTTFATSMESPYYRLLVKLYFYCETILLTISIGRFSVKEIQLTHKLTVIILNAVCYTVMILVYVSVLFVGRKLRTGYEGPVLAFILSSAFTFATTLADQTSMPLAVISGAALFGGGLVAMAEYFLPEEGPFVQPARSALAGAIPQKLITLLQRLREAQQPLQEAQAEIILVGVHDMNVAEVRADLQRRLDQAVNQEGPAALEALREALREEGGGPAVAAVQMVAQAHN